MSFSLRASSMKARSPSTFQAAAVRSILSRSEYESAATSCCEKVGDAFEVDQTVSSSFQRSAAGDELL